MTSGERSSVEAFFEAYRAAFEAFDVTAIADLFAYPCQITGDSDEVAVATVPGREVWVPTLERLVAAYRAMGVGSAERLQSDVTELSPRLAQATVHWRLLDGEGRRIYDFEAAYTLADLGHGLQIAALAHNEPPRLRAKIEGERRA